MLKWPSKAIGAIVKLFEPLQDIDVYVEDTDDQVFYSALLRNAAQGRVRVERVFPLGNRLKVIRGAQEYSPSGRRSLFIIDGDLEWVKGDNPPRLPWLYRINAYCVENLILCGHAAVSVLSEEVVLSEEEASAVLDFQDWLKSVDVPLIELFAAYATVHTFNPGFRTVSNGVGVLCTKSVGGTTLDINKVNAAKSAAINAAEKIVSPETVRLYYERILDRAHKLNSPYFIVSGKDFLLPLLDFHLQLRGCKVKRKALRLKLAKNCSFEKLNELQEAMLTSAS